MIEPSLELVRIPDDKLAQAIHALVTNYTMPDGCEVTKLQPFQEQLEKGYYYRLVWPGGTTVDQVEEWHAKALRVLRLHKLGLV